MARTMWLLRNHLRKCSILLVSRRSTSPSRAMGVSLELNTPFRSPTGTEYILMPKQPAWCCLPKFCFIPMRHFDLHDTYVDAYCDQKYAVAASSRSLLLKCLLHCCWLAGTRLIQSCACQRTWSTMWCLWDTPFMFPTESRAALTYTPATRVPPAGVLPSSGSPQQHCLQTVLCHLCLLSFVFVSFAEHCV